VNLATAMPLSVEISKCDSMFIRHITAPLEGVVHIVLEEGGFVPQLNPEDFAEGVLTYQQLHPKKLPRRIFELTWKRCISYVATDETYAPSDRTKDEPLDKVRWLQLFEKSTFLTFVENTTFAVEIHSLKLFHFRVASYNWVVDIASDEYPEVVELEPEYR